MVDSRLAQGKYGKRIFDKIESIDDMYWLTRRPKAEDRVLCISRFSTIEVRAPDTQKNVDDALAVSAYIWGVAEAAKDSSIDPMEYLTEETDILQKNVDTVIISGKNSVIHTNDGDKTVKSVIYETIEHLTPVFSKLKVSQNIVNHLYKMCEE